MNRPWPAYRLKDLCEISSSRRIRAHEYQDSGVPFYRGKEIIERHKGALKVSTDLFISEERFAEVSAKNGSPKPGDLLLTSVGTLGIPYIVKPGERFYFKDGNLTWFRNFDGLDVNYLYYWLLSPAGKAELKRCTIGSSQPAFTIVLLKDIDIELPDSNTQQRIASILSAYDALIENNSRRIEILEEMARRLYEEWFVHFRFPGHQEVEFKESELGMIPEGWEIGTLQDIVVLQRGFDLPVKKRLAGDYPIIAATGVNGFHNESKVQGPAVVTGRSGSLGKVMFIQGEFWPLNTSLWGKSYPLGSPILAYYTLSAIDLKSFNTGAAVPTLNRNDIHILPVVLPSPDIVKLFDSKVLPLHELMDVLEKKNANLRTQRDLLLPKLVSGEIDVSDFPLPDDKEIEAA